MMLGACACLGYQWPEKRLAAAQAAARLGSRAKGLWSDLWRAKR